MHNFGELYRYCYCVAGTVGLAMTHVMSVNSPQALVAAENLGVGMQLTNILRDVGGDLAWLYLSPAGRPRTLRLLACSSDSTLPGSA